MEQSSSAQRLLLRDVYHLVSGDAARTRLRGVDLLIEGARIADIGRSLPTGNAEVIDCSTKLVLPGLVNTHHHMVQTLQRVVPRVQNEGLFRWLQGLYPIWQHIDAEAVFVGTQLACAELLMTGCTTTSEHQYLFPPAVEGDLLTAQIRAARQLGIRFNAVRGSMSVSVASGGLPPESVVEAPEAALRGSEDALKHHDGDPLSMCRVAFGPCSPFNVSPELYRDTAELARRHGVRLHTHLAETRDEERYCLERYGCRPLQLLEQCNWLGPDVWLAHGIHFNDDELALLARTRTGIAHCASSNMRLGSGICRVVEMLERGIRLGLAVDGSASNDSSDMLGELRQCLLLQRVAQGAAALDAEQVLELATRGGADLLGWDELGQLDVGAPADLALFELNRLDYAGALSDPLAALIFCGISHQAHTVIVNGRIVVRDGVVLGVDTAALRDQANRVAKRMLAAAGHDTTWMP